MRQRSSSRERNSHFMRTGFMMPVANLAGHMDINRTMRMLDGR